MSVPPTPDNLAPQYAAAVLQWYLDNGVDDILVDAPVNRLAATLPQPPSLSPSSPSQSPSPSLEMSFPSPQMAGAVVQGAPEIMAEASRLMDSVTTIEGLKAAIQSFDGLGLKKTAMNMVFAAGSVGARVMVIGDGPESQDDRTGQPFSGDVGDLTDKMFGAIGLKRGDLYLTNVLNWRPPGNRTPTPAEIDVSMVFLKKHIELVNPDYLFLMGAVAAKAVTGRDETVTRLRGGPHLVAIGGRDRNVFVTYHPSFLLRTPAKKREAWEDLQRLQQALLQ